MLEKYGKADMSEKAKLLNYFFFLFILLKLIVITTNSNVLVLS